MNDKLEFVRRHMKRMTDETERREREEATDVLRELDISHDFTPENVIKAIIDGKIPHVRFGD